MLSVLIPVKDLNPLNLIQMLSDQLITCQIPHEILVSDDSSGNQSLPVSKLMSDIPHFTYFCREQPLGRSANRNFLADQAQYPYLLFIDGDAEIVDQSFIENYLSRLDPDTILCGGTLYDSQPPEDQRFLLRWTFGCAREQVPAEIRQQRPWKSFSTFNFVVPAKIFKQIRFNESIKSYGHEDTLFGWQLHQSGIAILHLDNGLTHLGLEPAADFLIKVRESGNNLLRLYNLNFLPPDCVQDISLLATWEKIKKIHLTRLVAIWFNVRHKSIEKRLCGPKPSLFLLDLYKLGSLSQFA